LAQAFDAPKFDRTSKSKETEMSITMNRRRWIGLSLIGVAGAGALGALFAVPALGGGGPFGHGHGHGLWGRHGHHRFSEERVRAHVEWMLRGVDASAEQVDEITRIATATAADLHGARDRHADHAQIVAALSAETVDRAALETLRAEHVTAVETASHKLTDALAQIAEVLTPAQRAQLAAQHDKLRALHEAEAEE
jgi:Spy/CpxP family protein refolding chaperone